MTLQPHIYGNQKPKKADKVKAKNVDKRKDRPGNSEKHLALIRTLPCCIPGCTTVGCDPHHLKQTGTQERGMGMRSPDRWAVPLCRRHHDEVERVASRSEIKWFADRGIEPLELANALWMVSPDRGALVRVVLAHKSSLPSSDKGE